MAFAMTSRERVLAALRRQPADQPAVGSATSVISIELMEEVGVFFPEAHLDPEAMAELAGFAHTRGGGAGVRGGVGSAGPHARCAEAPLPECVRHPHSDRLP